MSNREYPSASVGRPKNLLTRRQIRARAEEVKTLSSIEISPDPKDEPFCLCAEQGMADFIVTLDPKDFPADRLKAEVVSPDLFPV